ncbi:protein LONGIFOLIA 2-like isoform X2 [Hibiscus syriacus]|uniref:protein LONGIFOLIA 2-like isoform X2 n=1 Tax=Hibiscus syriacus TaxID=106335 RepID=UPI001925099D|nr:protein LONGIFOLIA 2-like isoform X2 [Hibiscus syriacus]
MMTGIMAEQNLEERIGKQMGCMAGFLQIFDRQQLPTGKRLYSTKRLPPSPSSETTSEEEKAVESPFTKGELEEQTQGRLAPSPDRFKESPGAFELRSQAPEPSTPTGNQNKASLPFPIFQFKEGSTRSPFKFSKEAPRLSLDSRAVVDAKGSLKPSEIRTNQCKTNSEENGVDDNDKQRRSPSVIARLMGLGSLPNSDPEPNGKAELRRSASEARGRDLFQYRFIDGVNFHLKESQLPNFQNDEISSNALRENGGKQEHLMNNRSQSSRNVKTEPMKAAVRGIGQRKCFYDSADFFPEPKQPVSIYGEIEKRLKLRGIDEPSKDLETLKQILEALQLKGLLHNKKPLSQTNNRNFVYENEPSPITVIKPGRSPASPGRRIGNETPSSSNRPWPRPRRNLNIEVPPTKSPRNDRSENERNQRKNKGSISPTRSEWGVRSPSRRPLSVETQSRGNGSVEQRRVSPIQSPRVNLRKARLDQTSNSSPRNRKSKTGIYQKEKKVIFVPAEDETSTVSESSFSTCSQTDTERSRAVEEYKEGRSLLERCDKLLHSIAEMTASTELEPSPVSVLDSSFYKEEMSVSPVKKQSIDFKDDTWNSSDESKSDDKSDVSDFIYISDILRASNYLPDDSDVFSLLEKQQLLKGKDTSKASRHRRKLIFDIINEILNRKRRLPAWKLIDSTNSGPGETSLRQIWSEFQKIRERDSSDDLFEVICGVLRKDLAVDSINGWGDQPVEMSESILDIERLIFKDLIVETIQDLAVFSGRSHEISALRRKLAFL